MSLRTDNAYARLNGARKAEVDQLCDLFEAALKTGQEPSLEDYLKQTQPEARRPLLEELICLEVDYRRRAGRVPTAQEYVQRFPEIEKDWLERILADTKSNQQTMTFERLQKNLIDSGLVDPRKLTAMLKSLPKADRPTTARSLARTLVQQKRLTKYQAKMVYNGRWKNLILGNYLLLERIGQGGMGVVFSARHQRMGRLVALKTLHPWVTRQSGAIGRFLKELKAAGVLSHPNVITTHDAGEQNGIHYLVMEYVPGHDLATLLKRDGPMPIDVAINYLLQAAEGLHYAHEQGIIHRDVKPHNLIVNKDGVVKVLDFGMARFDPATARDLAFSTTTTGAVLGTVDYLAPEQAVDPRSADRRSDIYSLGCTLYSILTGKTVYPGDSYVEIILAHQQRPIVSLCDARPEVPARLNRVFQKMIAKQPDSRHASMAEVIEDLQKATQERPRAGQSSRPTMRWTRRRALTAGVAVALTAVAGPLAYYQLVEQPTASLAKSQMDFARRHDLSVSFLEKTTGISFVLIPPGKLEFDSLADNERLVQQLVEQEANLSDSWRTWLENEEPIPQEKIEHYFYISETEITIGQYRQFITSTIQAGRGHGAHAEPPSEKTGLGFGVVDGHWEPRVEFNWLRQGEYEPQEDHPVGNVSWHDAVAFCSWLTNSSNQADFEYDLPTELEWEYACRAGSTSAWHFSNDPADLDDYAWYVRNSAARPQPVRQKSPNNFGLYDMHGNVWEWCRDKADSRFLLIGKDAHAKRGGGFLDPPVLLRSSCRYGSNAANPKESGFRVVRRIKTSA